MRQASATDMLIRHDQYHSTAFSSCLFTLCFFSNLSLSSKILKNRKLVQNTVNLEILYFFEIKSQKLYFQTIIFSKYNLLSEAKSHGSRIKIPGSLQEIREVLLLSFLFIYDLFAMKIPYFYLKVQSGENNILLPFFQF